MGNADRRHSRKMIQREGKRAKKARLSRQAEARRSERAGGPKPKPAPARAAAPQPAPAPAAPEPTEAQASEE